ncbi:restriction endonuclease subunit S [Salinibacter pepae]|uniref:restriction endonuclease subunit S n=1 Tax=Salinibacter pepae TaxID=3040382 RepID=UPI0021E6FA7E|nr:restriction endonuclease subunit S [Salinibacter pepae]
MSDDLDFDMDVVEEDELDEMGADGALSPKEDFRSEASREESDTGTNETDDAESISSRMGSLATDSDREVFGLGSVPEEWDMSSLPSVVEIEMGSSPPSSTYNEQEEGLPFYQGNADFGHMRPKVSTWCSDPVKTADKDDVLISIRAPVGDLNIADEHCCIGRGLAALRPKEVNGLYLFYGLAQRSRWLSRLASGSTFKSVSSADLEKVDLPVPPLPEQRKIASVLYAVDQAIQKTEAIIEQAQRVKRGVVQKLLNGEAGEDLEEKKEFRLGPKLKSLPSNWEVTPLEQVAEVSGGKRLPKGHDYADKKTAHPYLRVTDMKGGSIDPEELEYLKEETYQKISRYTISTNDVYISIAGTIGVAGVIPEELDGANLTENAARIHGLDGVKKDYLSIYLQSKFGQDEVYRMTVGSSQPKLSLFRIKRLEVVLPPLDLQKRIASVVERFDQRISSEQKLANHLRSLKKGLMQDLLTGEVRTADKAIDVLDEVVEHG